MKRRSIGTVWTYLHESEGRGPRLDELPPLVSVALISPSDDVYCTPFSFFSHIVMDLDRPLVETLRPCDPCVTLRGSLIFLITTKRDRCFVFLTIFSLLRSIPAPSEHLAMKDLQYRIGRCVFRMDLVRVSKKYIVVMRTTRKIKMRVYYATGDLSNPPNT
jgi:hypothetical protein